MKRIQKDAPFRLARVIQLAARRSGVGVVPSRREVGTKLRY